MSTIDNKSNNENSKKLSSIQEIDPVDKYSILVIRVSFMDKFIM